MDVGTRLSILSNTGVLAGYPGHDLRNAKTAYVNLTGVSHAFSVSFLMYRGVTPQELAPNDVVLSRETDGQVVIRREALLMVAVTDTAVYVTDSVSPILLSAFEGPVHDGHALTFGLDDVVVDGVAFHRQSLTPDVVAALTGDDEDDDDRG